MKKSILFAFLLLLMNNGFCQVLISGRITNAPEASEINITWFNNDFEFEEISLGKIKPDKEGNFMLQIKLDKPTSAKFTIAEQYTEMFLVPNDSLYITIDYNKFDETLHYAGRGASDNQYVLADLLANFNMQAQRHRPFDDADKFAAFIDSIERENQLFFKAHDSPKFTPEFHNHMTATIKYRYIYPRCMYQVAYNPETQTFYNKPVPANYFDFLKNINLNDQSVADNISYESAISNNYLYELYNDIIEKEIPASLSKEEKDKLRMTKGYELRKQLFKDKILDYQLTHFVKYNITYGLSDLKSIKELIADYKTICKNPEYTAVIDRAFNRANALAAGNPAPDFTLTDKNGKQVTLSSLKGKVVYIDFWATWCGPCMAEMPRSHQLMEKFKNNKEVVFLYVNVRDDKESWEKYVKKQKMKGLVLFGDEVQSAEISKLYNFNGIPHYVLIDKNGNLINANAERPGTVEKDILAALK